MGRVTGSLVVVERKTGPVYFLKARDRDGRQVKKRLGLVADWPLKRAQDELRDFLTDLGRVPERGDTTVTVRYAVAAWLTYIEHDRGREPSTMRDYRNTMNRQIVGRFGDRALADLTLDDLERLRAELLSTLSRRTSQKTLVLLHGMYRFACRKGWTPTNLAAEVEPIEVRRRAEFAVLSPVEVQAAARAAPGDLFRVMILVAAFTGLRLSELRALRWRDVDFTNRLVHVRRKHYGAKGATDGPPKSKIARSVPLIDFAAAPLDELSRRVEHTASADHVFCDETIRGALYSALEGAKIDRDRGTGKLFVFHDLRHTFGTLAVRAWPLSDVQAYMGHADISTTMLYVHHQSRARAADELGAVVAAELGTQAGTRAEGERVPVGTELPEDPVI
jgi:integrase